MAVAAAAGGRAVAPSRAFYPAGRFHALDGGYPLSPGAEPATKPGRKPSMIILGVILLILGALLDVAILWTLGIILVVIGAILWIAGSMGRAVGPRSHYW
jgi:hypothetical protein